MLVQFCNDFVFDLFFIGVLFGYDCFGGFLVVICGLVFIIVFVIMLMGVDMIFVELNGCVLIDLVIVCCFVGVVFGWDWVFIYFVMGVFFVVDCY